MNFFKKIIKFFDLTGSDEYKKLKAQADAETWPQKEKMIESEFYKYVSSDTAQRHFGSGVLTKRAAQDLALGRNGSYSTARKNKRQEFYD